MAAGGKLGNDGLRRIRRFHVAVLIWKANQRARVAGVEPLRIRPRRIEVDAEHAALPGCKRRDLLRLAVSAAAPEHGNFAGAALGDKEIAIRSHANLPRLFQVFRVQLHLEPGRDLRHRTGRPRGKRSVAIGRCRIRLGQIVHGDLAEHPRLHVARVRERAFAGDKVGDFRAIGVEHGGAGRQRRGGSNKPFPLGQLEHGGTSTDQSNSPWQKPLLAVAAL